MTAHNNHDHDHGHTHSHPPPVAAGERRLVTVDDLWVEAGGRTILEGIGLHVNAGEIVTLIGPNGAGKSTMVKAVLGLVKPARGRARVEAGVRVGYMPQRLKVEATLPLSVARVMTLTRPATRPAIVAALEETGAAALIDQPVISLSGGELQRVLLARALLTRPDLLVLDEPAQAVDVHGQASLYRLIAAIRDRHGCGVLLVSHDLHLVMGRTDRVLCLNRHLCCSGAPEAVGRHPEYMRLFGQGAGAFAVYAHEHDHRHVHGGDVVPLDHPTQGGGHAG